MSKELDEIYKSYSSRITEIDDTLLVKIMDGGKFKLLSIEEYEEITNKISDLEAKLAESEHRNKQLVDALNGEVFINYKLPMENAQLKQQLAEKDVDLSLARNEIDTLKHNLKVAQEHNNVICEQYFEKCKKHKQDKISFCIEKLEHLRNVIDNETYYCYGDNNINIVINKNKFNEEIDNQIAELKE